MLLIVKIEQSTLGNSNRTQRPPCALLAVRVTGSLVEVLLLLLDDEIDTVLTWKCSLECNVGAGQGWHEELELSSETFGTVFPMAGFVSVPVPGRVNRREEKVAHQKIFVAED